MAAVLAVLTTVLVVGGGFAGGAGNQSLQQTVWILAGLSFLALILSTVSA